jgi:hypothetical protein
MADKTFEDLVVHWRTMIDEAEGSRDLRCVATALLSNLESVKVATDEWKKISKRNWAVVNSRSDIFDQDRRANLMAEAAGYDRCLEDLEDALGFKS